MRRGLDEFRGDAVAVYMADASDRPEDLVRFFRAMLAHHADCVFGSRFMPGGRTFDYPLPKLILNRLANTFIQVLFGIGYNDTTNAFKLYRRHVIDGVRPLLSHHFNLTVELPLKSIVRGFSYVVVFALERDSTSSNIGTSPGRPPRGRGTLARPADLRGRVFGPACRPALCLGAGATQRALRRHSFDFAPDS